MVDFDYGSKERFLEFVNAISEKDKVALITHIDLDGVASAKVISSALKIDFLKFVQYTDLNDELFNEIKKSGANKIIFSDILVTDDFVSKFSEDVLIIDHHVAEKDFNSENIVFVSKKGYCGAYLSYLLFSEINELEDLDWLVAMACLSDYCYFENTDFMEEVFENYGQKFDKKFVKKNKLWKMMNIISYTLVYFDDDVETAYNLITDFDGVWDLKKYYDEVNAEISELIERFEDEKEVYGDIYFWEFDSRFKIKSIVSNILSFRERDKTFIFVSPRDDYMTISARRQDKEVDVSELLKKIVFGIDGASAGGHVPAAGGNFLKKDLKVFKKKLSEVSENEKS